MGILRGSLTRMKTRKGMDEYIFKQFALPSILREIFISQLNSFITRALKVFFLSYLKSKQSSTTKHCTLCPFLAQSPPQYESSSSIFDIKEV